MQVRVRRGVYGTLAAVAVLACGVTAVLGDRPEPEIAAERGRIALTSTGYLKPAWSDAAYRRAGRLWGGDAAAAAPDPETEPEAYAAAFNRRFGLHPAPYSNDGLPMGLRRGNATDGTKTGLQIDCLVCHGGA